MSDWIARLDISKRIHVLHPYSSARIHLIREALHRNALYWRLEGHNLDSAALMAQWEEVSSTHHLQGWILIDEADRADDESLSDWLERALPPQAQLLIITRRIPASIYAPAWRSRCEIFPHDPVRLLNDFTRYNGDRHLLEVRTLGKGQALLNGRVIDNWEGVLPRLLFFYFVDKGITTRSDIFNVFWPDFSVKEATNVFHVTKRKLHEIIGIDLTIYDRGFYRLAPHIDLSYDVLSFSRLIQESEIVGDTAAESLISDALSLYRGEFLGLFDTPWINRRRHEIIMAYVDALVRLAVVRQRLGQSTSAINLYLRAWSLGIQESELLELAAALAQEQGDRVLAQTILAQIAATPL